MEPNSGLNNILNQIALKLLKNPLREFYIKKRQKRLLNKNYNPHKDRLIIFFTTGINDINGGILSISSIHDESRKLEYLHKSDVIMCSIPGHPLLLKYTKFKNDNYIYSLPEIVNHFKNLKSLLIHIPECYVATFLKNLSHDEFLELSKIDDLRINLMIQNIEMVDHDSIKDLTQKFNKITATTAHDRYCNVKMRETLGFPLHKLSTYVSPERYNKKSYNDKEEVIIVSPDSNPLKSEILKKINLEFPYLKIQIVKNISYEQFKDLSSRAKWAITFGEGLDGYFVEPIFSGAISFSIYNEKFFTEDFNHLKTVYIDYDELIKKIVGDIKDLDQENIYSEYQDLLYNLCSNHYNHDDYVNNLKLFYKGIYTYK